MPLPAWSWESPDWPYFRFDPTAVQWAVARYAAESGRLHGGVAQLQNLDQQAASLDLMVAEAISTSAIEGEHLDRDSVRSSLRRQLGLAAPARPRPDPQAERMASLMLAVRQNLNAPLTQESLFAWHALVLGDGQRILGGNVRVGAWRTDAMAIVSGALGYERVHYEAPPPERIAAEMSRFLGWFNATHPVTGDPVKRLIGPVRAAVAHLWFEIIHPFDDGNGRIGRSIAELCLAQDMQRPVLMSLSATLDKHRADYYRALNAASRSLQIDSWVTWFCERVLEAQEQAAETVNFVLGKARFWDRAREYLLNERQHKALRRMFEAGPDGFEGGMTARKYVSLTGCSKATATRDLAELLAWGCLVQLPGAGRSTAYVLALPQTHVSLDKAKAGTPANLG